MREQSNIDDMDEMDVRFVAVSLLFSFGADDTHSDACFFLIVAVPDQLRLPIFRWR
jgi:hypothetical protein